MNVTEVVTLEEVALDLQDGRQFYDKQSPRIGIYFWDSLISDIESLIIYAGVHSKYFGLHRMPAKRFPYAIYYFVYDQTAYVVAVLPMKRNPSWIRKQLNGRS